MDLKNLRNVGKAALADLELLEIRTVKELAKADPVTLYEQLQEITGKRHDPCVLDVFMAIVHEAQTGEKTDWWEWTPKRKKLIQS